MKLKRSNKTEQNQHTSISKGKDTTSEECFLYEYGYVGLYT